MTEPYVTERGVLVIQNRTKRTVHVAEATEYETVTGGTTRSSLCGMQTLGGGEHISTELHWLEYESFPESEAVMKDDEFLGKLCELCAKELPDD